MEESRSIGTNKIFWITICTILILAAGLRMYGLTRQSLWYDEANGVRIAEKSFSAIISELQERDVSPPLHYFVLHIWIKIFGSGELSVRSFAALFGILLIPVVCYIGSSMFNRRVGIISAFMASISQFHIAYSQEVRMYSMLALLGLLSMFFLHKAITTNNRASWMAYVLCTVLTIYTHNYGLFIAASGVVFFIVYATTQKVKWKIFLIAQGIIAVCYVPWLPILLMRQFRSKENDWIPQMQAYDVFETFKRYNGLFFDLFSPAVNNLIIYLGFCTFFCCFIAGIFSLRKYRRLLVPYVEHNSSLLLLLCYLFVTLAIPMIISLKKPIFLAYRHSIAAWPAFVLILGLGVSKIKKLYRLLPVIALILFFASVSLYWHYFIYVKSYDRTIANFIDRRASKDDLIVFAPDYLAVSVNYYLRTPLKHLGYPWPSKIETVQNTQAERGRREPSVMTHLVETKLGNSTGKVFLVSSEAKWIDGIQVVRKLFDESYKKIENVKYAKSSGPADVAIYIRFEELRRDKPVTIE